VLTRLLRRFGVALVASGHLHKAHQFVCDGTRYVWGPSSAFLGGPEVIPEMPGEKRLGAVCYEIDGAELSVNIVAIPGLAEHWIDHLIEDIYPLHLDSRPTKT